MINASSVQRSAPASGQINILALINSAGLPTQEFRNEVGYMDFEIKDIYMHFAPCRLESRVLVLE